MSAACGANHQHESAACGANHHHESAACGANHHHEGGARDLIRSCLDLPALLDRIGDDEDLVGGGVNSGELVKIALECENRIGRLLTDDELAELSTVHAVEDLLRGEVS
jgi:acyl carrier protein